MSKVIAQNFGGVGKILMGGKDYVTVWKKKDYHAITCNIWPAKSVTLSDTRGFLAINQGYGEKISYYMIKWNENLHIYYILIITLV